MSLTGDLGACCMLWKGAPGTGGSGILCLSLSLLFPLFSSHSFPPLLFVATISLKPSFSLAFTFPFSLSHSHFVCPIQCSVLSPTFSFFSHTLTSCVYNFLLSAQFTFLLSHFPFLTHLPFLPHQFSFLSPIYTISLSHTHFSFHFSFLSIQFSFLFLPPSFYFPRTHSYFLSPFLSPSPPTFNLFPHVFAFSRTHSFPFSLPSTQFISLCHTFTLSHSFTFTLQHTKNFSPPYAH